tara:strand:- start:784 stop:2160 length:1377 start_codon:yes stop_codon:yes gene_type:complete
MATLPYPEILPELPPAISITLSEIAVVPIVEVVGGQKLKKKIFLATEVETIASTPPKYTKTIIAYDDAKGSGGKIIGVSNNQSKIVFDTTTDVGKLANNNSKAVEAASSSQISSISDDVAKTSEEKDALNNLTTNKNNATNDGIDEVSVSDGEKGGGSAASTTKNFFGASKSDSGTRNKFDTLLVYPETLRQEKHDIIKFDMLKYEPKGIGNNTLNGKFGPGENRKRNRKSIGTVVLPIPAGISDSNQAGWQSGTMNAGQMILAQVGLKAVTEGFQAAANEGKKQVENIAANKDEAKTALTTAIVGAATGDTAALLQRTTGQIINPNVELLFSRPELRQFSFAFQMSARTPEEGATILKIIRFFKQGMSPIKTQGNLFLKSPHTFRLNYERRSAEHRGLNKFKECALVNCGVEYTPDGNYAAYEDGVMTSYRMTLGFNELEPIFNNDYNEFSDADIGF